MRSYRLTVDSLQWKFQKSRNKIQIFGGGFGNGKTTSAVVKVLSIARDYPGANILVARSTLQKLNSTVRKEFVKWTPSSWIKTFPLPKQGSTTLELKNGTTIVFNYFSQSGIGKGEDTTSNLLSANYDLIFIDQMDDPEITKKDMDDLLGRLRGQAEYRPVGDFDSTMPSTGPRFAIFTLNPTRNWFYRDIIKPYQDFLQGRVTEKLILSEKTGKCLIDLFEGSTYTNSDNLPEDFIETLEASYKGQMKKRFLDGEWGAFEGLIYPEFNPYVHIVKYDIMNAYFESLFTKGYKPQFLEAFDYGVSSPSCYGLAYSDRYGNVHLIDGFHAPEMSPDDSGEAITRIRKKYRVPDNNEIFADPSIFRRSEAGKLVGSTIADMISSNYGLQLVRANNAIMNGITKVQQYIHFEKDNVNPYTGDFNAPKFYVSDTLSWFDTEIGEYYWSKDTLGDRVDKPIDRRDHAMDMLKYLLTRKPQLAKMSMTAQRDKTHLNSWNESEIATTERNHRHG